jgi:hypothetical protein
MRTNIPYAFVSDTELEDFVQKERNETLDSLYRKEKSIWEKFNDAFNNFQKKA